MISLRRFVPRTLLLRAFLLLSLLLLISVATWLTLFSLAEQEPRARQVGELAASVVNLTHAALVNAQPAKRLNLLRDLAESEGVHIYPAEQDDDVDSLPDTFFFRIVAETIRDLLGPDTRVVGTVNGQSGIWTSFSIGNTADDDYWLMLPGERAETAFPWQWLAWAAASLALTLAFAWVIVSHITRPLRRLVGAAREVGQGRHPKPVPEEGAAELCELAEAFNRMSDSLQRIDAERAEVLAGISHDLRTPLARLRLELELAISDDDAREGIAQDIEQMDAIIRQFLIYARGEGKEAPERLDVNALITQVASAQERSGQHPQLNLGKLPPASVHRQALTRAVTNLMENARKYGDGEIRVETRHEQGDILIDVLDRGPGIPEDEVERLKRPFTRLENARSNASGTGLGLAIVERIARLHGGRLELLNREGGGLIARLRFPRRP